MVTGRTYAAEGPSPADRPTPEGVLSSALIANPQADHIMEVFAHPFTAGELHAQSMLGVLRVNGIEARAEVVDRLGNGDYIVRIILEQPVERHLELAA